MDVFTLEDLKKASSWHYLGYHTRDTMSYEFDDAQPFTLVTSNLTEADRVSSSRDILQNGFVWVIEGRKDGNKRRFYLREVFRPDKKFETAGEADYSGAKKKFFYRLSGTGLEFEEQFPLNDEPWFPAFKKSNGNFGFGLRILKDEEVKAHFLIYAAKYFTENRS